MVLCGDGFTMAGTNDNTLYYWGSRPSRQRHASETGDKTDTEPASVKKHKRNASGSMSIGSSDSLDYSSG
jgi:alpha-tubulin suppressor-like RCC1 family protein